MKITIDGAQFKDEFGRTLMLRGVNLGGGSKVPYQPDGATHNREGFFNHRQVSFVGRPLPLAEADEHFRRLKAWGFTFLRFLVTWEAIEHAGPGQYDSEYLDYVRAVVMKAGDYGISLFIDPHQDMWSRFSGGDGATGWTLEAAGLDMNHFAESGAAIAHQTHGDPFPKMIWPTNEGKLATATMFTLFFGGNDFAPQTKVDGEPIQEYLQRHYINAILQVVERLKDLTNVVGYDTLNEPLAGYIGWQDLNRKGGELNLGESPTPFQAMLLGEGIPQEVAVWKLGWASLVQDGTRRLNPGRVRAWLAGRECIWRQHGVWNLDAAGNPNLLRPDYFKQVNGHPVEFNRDYFVPFARRCAGVIRAADPRALIFVESVTGGKPPRWEGEQTGHLVYAPHWYDGYVVVKLSFSSFLAVNYFTQKLIFGQRAIRKSFAQQMAELKQAATVELGGVPTLVGEFGIPFNLDDGMAYRTGDFHNQMRALDRSFQALEANLLNGTLWNYTADNTHFRGDLWNGEDFSIFSRDQQANPQDINSGGRALAAAVRPYPRATAGEPERMSFDIKSGLFEFRFRHDDRAGAPTEIFVPELQYSQGFRIEVSDGTYEVKQQEQAVIYRHGTEREEHSIRILRK